MLLPDWLHCPAGTPGPNSSRSSLSALTFLDEPEPIRDPQLLFKHTSNAGPRLATAQSPMLKQTSTEQTSKQQTSTEQTLDQQTLMLKPHVISQKTTESEADGKTLTVSADTKADKSADQTPGV